MRTIPMLLAVTLAVSSAAGADRSIRRKPLTLKLFLQPFKPQTVTPQIFGLLPENEYLQKEIKLTAAQKERMRQIEMQLTRDSTVLLQADVRRALGLSEKQIELLENLSPEAKKTFEAFHAKWKKSLKGKRPTRAQLAELRKRGEKLEAGMDSDAVKLLTREQQVRYRKLKGAAVDAAKIFNRINLRVDGLASARLSRPFKRQINTPLVFGLASYSDYVQRELKVTREQTTRMRQIELQLTLDSSLLTRIHGLSDQGLNKELAITAQQTSRMRELCEQHKKRARTLTTPAAVGLPEFQKKRATILVIKNPKARLKALKKLTEEFTQSVADAHSNADRTRKRMERVILDVLTRSQQEKLRRLKGKKIDPVKIFESAARPPRERARPDV